jgi:hypothetical protein
MQAQMNLQSPRLWLEIVKHLRAKINYHFVEIQGLYDLIVLVETEIEQRIF